MSTKNYIFLSGVSLALWIIFANALFWVFPLAFVGSATLGWTLGRSDGQNSKDLIAYGWSVGPAAVAAIISLWWWMNNPNETFDALPGWLAVVNFVFLIGGFSTARHIFPTKS